LRGGRRLRLGAAAHIGDELEEDDKGRQQKQNRPKQTKLKNPQ
jgi:hypothetical protein